MNIDELRNSLIAFDARFQETTHTECWNKKNPCSTKQIFLVECEEQTITVEVAIQFIHNSELAKKIWVKIQPEHEEVRNAARGALDRSSYLRKLFINGLPEYIRNTHWH